jgi:hypothetical protein
MLGFANLIPDCWLEVSLHSEGPVTGQQSILTVDMELNPSSEAINRSVTKEFPNIFWNPEVH